MNATCRPDSIACSAASAAMIVLPLPTSPCSSRCIGVVRFRSWLISRQTRSCARVSLNGTRASSAPVSAPVPVSTGARRAARALRCALSDSCCATSSSNLRRVHAGCVRASSACCVSGDSRGGGACRKRTASRELPQVLPRDEPVGQRFGGERGIGRRARARSPCAASPARGPRSSDRRASAGPAAACPARPP